MKTTAGLDAYTTPKYASISYVVRKAGETPTKKIQQWFRGVRTKGVLNQREETKTRQVRGQITKTGPAKPAGTGRRNHHKCKGSELYKRQEDQGSTPTQARKHACWSKVGGPWNLLGNKLNPKEKGKKLMCTKQFP